MRISNRWNFSKIDPSGQMDDFVRAITTLLAGNIDGKNLAEYITIQSPDLEGDTTIKTLEADLNINSWTLYNLCVRFKTATKLADYTALATDCVLLCNATIAPMTITLPVGVAGRFYLLKKIDVSDNKVTIDANGTETIDGATEIELTDQYESVMLVNSGSEWGIH